MQPAKTFSSWSREKQLIEAVLDIKSLGTSRCASIFLRVLQIRDQSPSPAGLVKLLFDCSCRKFYLSSCPIGSKESEPQITFVWLKQNLVTKPSSRPLSLRGPVGLVGNSSSHGRELLRLVHSLSLQNRRRNVCGQLHTSSVLSVRMRMLDMLGYLENNRKSQRYLSCIMLCSIKSSRR